MKKYFLLLLFLLLHKLCIEIQNKSVLYEKRKEKKILNFVVCVNLYKVSMSFVEKKMKEKRENEKKTEQNCEINFPFLKRDRPIMAVIFLQYCEKKQNKKK